MNRSLFAALAALMVACSGDTDTKTDSASTTGDTGDTTTDPCPTPFTGATIVQTGSVTCDGSDNVTFDIMTDGWTTSGSLYEIETANNPPWSDEHDLVSYDYDACGAWDKLDATVATGAAVADWEPNVSTVFTCANHYEVGVMTYAAGVYDTDGAFADCMAWGEDPDSVIDSSITGPNDPSFDVSGCAVGTATM